MEGSDASFESFLASPKPLLRLGFVKSAYCSDDVLAALGRVAGRARPPRPSWSSTWSAAVYRGVSLLETPTRRYALETANGDYLLPASEPLHDVDALILCLELDKHATYYEFMLRYARGLGATPVLIVIADLEARFVDARVDALERRVRELLAAYGVDDDIAILRWPIVARGKPDPGDERLVHALFELLAERVPTSTREPSAPALVRLWASEPARDGRWPARRVMSGLALRGRVPESAKLELVVWGVEDRMPRVIPFGHYVTGRRDVFGIERPEAVAGQRVAYELTPPRKLERGILEGAPCLLVAPGSVAFSRTLRARLRALPGRGALEGSMEQLWVNFAGFRIAAGCERGPLALAPDDWSERTLGLANPVAHPVARRFSLDVDGRPKPYAVGEVLEHCGSVEPVQWIRRKARRRSRG